jgi:O-antigen/teichoic acid export membrane protein
MRKFIKQIITNPFFAGSAVMIIGSNAVNFLNYVYHLVMGRLLGPSSYGELATLFSLLSLLGIIPLSLNLVIMKYVSSNKTKNQISNLVRWLNKKIFIGVGIVFIIISLSSPFFSSFLKINNPLFFIAVGIVFVSVTMMVFNRSILQGLLRFNSVVATLLTENGLKLLLGVIFVCLGFSVGGTMVGLLLATLITWFLTTYFLKDYFKNGRISAIDIKPMFFYSIPVLIQSIAITSLYSTDVVLVKHFFSPHEAGIYAALSTLGKIIFFGTLPISAVMFPIVSKKYALKENYQKIFLYSLILTCLISAVIVAVYWKLPDLAIKVLYGSSYLEATMLLVWFGIFMALFSLAYLFTNFYLSLGKVRLVVLPLLAALFQIAGIWFYHHNLYTVILISIIISSLFLAGCLGYFWYLLFAQKHS